MTDSRFSVRRNGRGHEVVLHAESANIDGQNHALVILARSEGSVVFSLDGQVHRFDLQAKGVGEFTMVTRGRVLSLACVDQRTEILARFAPTRQSQAGTHTLNAPMPGLVSRIERAVGQSISKGEGILILEAMKMENEIKSPVTGKISEIKVRQGQTVEKSAPLVTILAT